jgi:N-acetyl-beta-hexosaminidase
MLKDNPGLHAYFNTRVHRILARHGKKLVGWDEILHPDLPADSLIHSWRGPEGIAEATKRGFATILSNGYYIDLCYPGWQHYLNDPVPAGTSLTPEQQKLVLGGEATMWSEWVTPETIDSRIWPRTAAIARSALCRTCTAARPWSANGSRRPACGTSRISLRRSAGWRARTPRPPMSPRCARLSICSSR